MINTFEPERLARLKRLLILGDKRDPVAPERACLHFARGVADATVRMVYDEGRHHPIGQDALQRYAVPFLQNRPVPEVLPHSERFKQLMMNRQLKPQCAESCGVCDRRRLLETGS